MKSEKEIREFLEKLREIEIVIHPSVIRFGEWILEIGDKEEQKFWLQIMNGTIEAYRRDKKWNETQEKVIL